MKDGIRSSSFAINYWRQGIGDYYVQSLLGPAYIYRGKKWFTFSIGYGLVVEKGPYYEQNLKTIAEITGTPPTDVPGMLTYSVGAYFPF